VGLPVLDRRHLEAEVWVKHENHTPVGAVKIRGGLVYFAHYAQTGELRDGVISATRSNHGQSLGFAARRYGVPATVVVPYGSSLEENAAMRSLGVELFRTVLQTAAIDRERHPEWTLPTVISAPRA
jgi:threonine dehydratase